MIHCGAGQAGTGKTALATYLSTSLKFPFVKVIDFFAIMGKAEGAASDVLHKAFDDASKSPLSVLILDDVSKLVQFAKHGPRYSLLLLHTLQSLLKQRPKDDRRMVVLATADMGVMRTLDLADSFAHVITLPTLTRDEAAMAMRDSRLAHNSQTLKSAVAQLPAPDVFETSIRTLTASLLHSSPEGHLDLAAWEGWQHAFQAPLTEFE
jgi:vesicle-fusing ATPase